MSLFDPILLLTVLACVWVFLKARAHGAAPSRRTLGAALLAFGVTLLLALSSLSVEWILHDLAGPQAITPAQGLEEAKQAKSPLYAAEQGFAAGMFMLAFERNRSSALTLSIAATLCLLAGGWSGRRRPAAPARAGDTANLPQPDAA